MGGNDNSDVLDKKKSHRERQSGRKADKKNTKKNENKNLLPDKQRNPKAFTFNSAVKAERRFRRKQDIETKKQHVPLIDRTPVEPPPILIAVVGPPKVGKSTVINNLIKLFTKSPLTDIKGPVTIVTGKKRRITLIECNNDINCMIDIAKVADLVLLLCDASFGFEMEIFEFLNICQVHGMPRIMGVLTHLDMIKNSKTLKNTKKVLKHRFWTEVYPGAKLFYLSGIVHGEYLRNEIKNLGRFISIIKFRPLTWRTTHSYLLGDRYEDLTSQELIRKNPKCDRTVSLYGYVRGVPLIKDTSIHIAGLGDLKIQDVTYLPDPCPLPEAIKKRSLIEKEKLIYAPFSGVGGIVYDKDAVYVELGGSHSHTVNTDFDDETKNIVSNLIDTKETLDIKMQHSELQLFTGGKKLTAKNMKHLNNDKVLTIPKLNLPKTSVDDDLDEELNQLRNEEKTGLEELKVVDSGRNRRRVVFDLGDEEFEKTIKESSDDESDSDVEENKEKTLQNYTTLKHNKDFDIHSKIAHTLKCLDTKSTKSKMKTSDFESDYETETDEEMDNEDESSNLDESADKTSKSKKEKKIKYLKAKNVDSENETDEEMNYKDDSSDFDEAPLRKIKLKSTKKEKLNDEELETNNDTSEDESIQKEIKDESVDESKNNEDEDISSDDSGDEDMAVKWKKNLAKKASEAFLDRQKTTQNIMKLVYGVFDKHGVKAEIDEEAEEDHDIGGIFKLVNNEQRRKKETKERLNVLDTSLFNKWDKKTKDWLEEENKILIENCFVTGKWKQSEDASELLRLDDINEFSDQGSEVFGDFEDLETGEKHTSHKPQQNDNATKRKHDELESEEPLNHEELIEKKRKLKEKFDAEYDDTEKTSFYDDLKISAEKQSQLNKSVFENMTDDLRVQIEGFRPGMYVRIEFENVPSEFITNFNPTYPLVIGALNIGEENIGYVNVKIKKHRWYSKILKTSDPLIISLGWRRFQTLPLFSKLEDDMKYRYLKYTPEHVTCNAHFWGPITPQATGFIALQSCGGDLEAMKRLGFRIAATGSVQELEKSTQIMKKLKLVGYPTKIFKKTAFIKDMFNTSLEVAKFEGAKIKTVSGIRGQIKKPINKPEGCFRATFEDKILMSDIVFCRTWYRIDVPKFYCPVTTLLLPLDKKNAWKGVRTVGELKYDNRIQIMPNPDNLYKPIIRPTKVFKPLVIPRKLQSKLPYRDKPKYGTLKEDRKPEKKRVAVIREPQEQKVANMLKMLRATYEHKQEQLKIQMAERIDKHKAMVEAQDVRKKEREKRERKNIFRDQSKKQIREEKLKSKKRKP